MTLRRTVACLVAATTVAGCAGGRPEVAPSPPSAAEAPDGPPPGPAIAAIRLTLTPASPRVGDTVRVEAMPVGPEGASLPTADIGVTAPRHLFAVIDGERTLVALREGSGVVIARATVEGMPDGVPAQASVDVRVGPAPLVHFDIAAPASMYEETRTRVTVNAGTIFGPRAQAPDISWTSSDPSVLRVTSAGGLHAVASGLARVEATAEGQYAATEVRVVENPVRRVELSPGAADVRVGEVVHLSPRMFDVAGRPVADVPVEWAAAAVDGGLEGSADVSRDGAFVANRPGSYRVAAIVGRHAAASVIRASARPAAREARAVAHRGVSDGAVPAIHLRVFEGVDGRDRAYTATSDASTLYVWDVTSPDSPRLADSVALPGGHVSDIEVDEEATLAVVASEGAPGRPGGVTLLDILNPGRPRVVTHLSRDLGGGVQELWIEGPVAYAAHGGDLLVLDVSDPASPRHIGRWGLESAGGALHDVVVKDGFAYLSSGYDGLVILDVGAGIAGGTPTMPRLVTRFAIKPRFGDGTPAAVRRAVRYRDWVFVANEVADCASCTEGARGDVRVLDVTDIAAPRDVARYQVPVGIAHDLWADDDLLYVAAGEGGVRILDVSGELRGDLREQRREIARFATDAPDGAVPNVPMARVAQAFEGRLYVSDRNSGLWILEIEGKAE